VIWPLLSQYVCLVAIEESVSAGCTFPVVSIARDAMECSSDDGDVQSKVQNLHAKPLDSSPGEAQSCAAIHGP